MEEWTIEEAGLLNEMKGNCLNKGQYIDKKAKDKFYMLCHLEDYAIQYYEQQEEIEKLKKENIKLYKKDTKIINELKEELEITQEKWNKDKQWSECRTKEWLDYKSRCERLLEKINFYKTTEWGLRGYAILDLFENILNGSDVE